MRSTKAAVFKLIGALCVGAAAAACSSDPAAGDGTSGESSFVSRAPADGNQSKSGDAAAGAETGAPTNDQGTVKVEEGDVVRVVGDRMLILNQFRGLQIVDVKDPTKPKRLAGLPSTGVPREMYIDGERVVLVQSNAYEVKAGDAGKLVAWSGSRVVTATIDAAGAAKAIGAVDVPGWIVHSRRIGDKIVVVTAETGWSPWFWGCYGPYGCVAEAGGVATDGVATGTKGGSTGDAAIGVAYPGGGWGWNVGGGAVRVLQLPAQGPASELGAAAFEGGVGIAEFGTGEVLLAGQRSGWDSEKKQSWVEDTLTRVSLGADGKPAVAAKLAQKTVLGDNAGWSWIGGAGRVGDGRLGVLRYQSNNAGQTLAIESWSAKGASFEKTAALAIPGGSVSATRFADARLLLVTAGSGGDGGTDETGTDVDGTDETGADGAGSGAGGKDDEGGSGSSGGSSGSSGGGATPVPGGGAAVASKLEVFELAVAATITSAGSVELGAAQNAWGIALHDLQAQNPGLWLLQGSANSGLALQTLQLDAKGKPAIVGSAKLPEGAAWYDQLEVLPSGLLLVGSYQKASKDEAEIKVQLMQVDAKGAIALRGAYAPKVPSWWKLASIEHGKVLLRASNLALEVIDLANLDKPAAIASLELVADVWDVAWAGERLVALTGGAQSLGGSGGATLRVLAEASADDLAPTGSVALKSGWGRLYAHGAMVYVVGDQGVEVFDVSDAKAPVARGSWTAPAQAEDGKSWGWWSSYETVQSGTTLWTTWHETKWVPDDPTCKGVDVVDGGSGGGGSGEVPATDAGAAEPQPADGGSSEPPAPDASEDKPAPVDAGSADAGTPDGPDAGGGGDDKDAAVKPVICTGTYAHATLIRAIDLANPDKPALGGEVKLDTVSWTSGAMLVGKTLVFTHYQSKEGPDGSWSGSYWLDRVDVSDPKAPKALAPVNVPGQVVALADDGKLVWTLDWQTAANSKPEDGKVSNFLCALKIVGNKAWLVKKVELEGHAGGARKVGDHLYLGLWQPWWQVAEGKQPTTTLQSWKLGGKGELSLAGSADLGVGASRIEAHGSWLFVGAGWSSGLMLFDIAAPAKPTFHSWLPYQGWASQVVVGGGAVHLAGGLMGVSRFPLP